MTDAGGSVLADPFDSPGGVRTAVVADPAEAVFCLLEPGERQGAQAVNEPDAWTMSALNTSDPEGAAELLRDGLRLDHRELRDGGDAGHDVPTARLRGRRARAAGVARDRGGDDAGGRWPAHWSVDLWVEDADATADRAAKLGGSVVAPPFDTPLSRMAVLADPGGAAFSVSEVPGS